MTTAARKRQLTLQKRKDAARKNAELRDHRDIAPLPRVFGRKRRDRCERDLALFCKTYLKGIFYRPWSPDHLEVIATLERIAFSGGKFVLAMPRASGKTSLVVAFVLWCIFYGHRSFVVIVAANQPKAVRLIEKILKPILNDPGSLISRDFPEAVYPIEKLEGSYKRAIGQLFEGLNTDLTYSSTEITFADIPGSRCAGSTIVCAGIESGSLRGLIKMKNGQIIRPDLAVPDDPQTEKSADSVDMTDMREEVIKNAVAELAGPGVRIAMAIPVTVIKPDDLSDRLLHNPENAEYVGRVYKLVERMPESKSDWEHWKRYRELRQESYGVHSDSRLADEYFRDHRKVFEASCDVSWNRKEDHQVSAVHYAVDKWAASESVFWAEFQNTPLNRALQNVRYIPADRPGQLVDGTPRGHQPAWAVRRTSFVDVQGNSLWWHTLDTDDSMRGHVSGYGIWPDQGLDYVKLSEVRYTLESLYHLPQDQSRIEGLLELLEDLTSHSDLTLVDANWHESTGEVFEVCRRFSNRKVMPSFGRYVGAASPPMIDWSKPDPATKDGNNWRTLYKRKGFSQKHVEYDANFWKSFACTRVLGKQEPSGLSVFGHDPEEHLMLGDHYAAEIGQPVFGRGRKCLEFKQRPGRDNHFWDGLVGCYVAASVLGGRTQGDRKKSNPQKVSFAEQQAAARRKRS